MENHCMPCSANGLNKKTDVAKTIFKNSVSLDVQMAFELFTLMCD